MKWWEWIVLALFTYGLYFGFRSLHENNQQQRDECSARGGHMTRYDGCVQGRRLM